MRGDLHRRLAALPVGRSVFIPGKSSMDVAYVYKSLLPKRYESKTANYSKEYGVRITRVDDAPSRKRRKHTVHLQIAALEIGGKLWLPGPQTVVLGEFMRRQRPKAYTVERRIYPLEIGLLIRRIR